MRVLIAIGVLLGTAGIASAAGHGHEVHADPSWWLLCLFTFQGAVIAFLASKRYKVEVDGVVKPALSEVQELSIFLLTGAVIAQFWAHGDPEGYHATMHQLLFQIPVAHVDVTLHFLINDVFMCLFFGIAAKELSEAALKEGGALRGKQGILPMLACTGGVVGPALVYVMMCTPDMRGAWAVPCATDIAFAWLGARAIWGPKHPAVIFLLALAIADDFVGMLIIAVFYPQHAFHFMGLVIITLGIVMAWLLKRYAREVPAFQKWQVYMIPGALCWFGLLYAGLHAALALVFVVPFMPMHGRDEGIFAEGESEHVHDTINHFEHASKPVVDIGLFYFGLANAGVAWLGTGAWNQNSMAVFLGLGIGKLVGITFFTVVGFVALKQLGEAKLPVNEGVSMQWVDVPVAGLLGAMGFTVALFVADAAGGDAALKLGALASFAYLGLAVLVGKKLCTPC